MEGALFLAGFSVHAATQLTAMMSANLHPDFRALQPSPLAGLCQDNNFGRELGATPADGGTAPANGFTAPDNRDTAPPMMVPPLPMDSPPLAVLCLARLLSEMMTSSSQTIQLLQALLHSGETTTEFAQRLFADQEPNKWSITVVMFIELSRQLHSLAHDRPTPARDVLPGATLKPLCCGKRSAFGSRCAALKVAVPPAALPLSRLRKKRGTATVSGSAAIIPLRYRFLSWARSGHPLHCAEYFFFIKVQQLHRRKQWCNFNATESAAVLAAAALR
ncbi:hypothetical protein PCASD_19958 [Puccinia coronata f. sp. avenae]|uniref:Uncharacterized protein n=1 Tax=Puccinia coronata f. sp. avenae TaxID=200324 RepID=A0A2N5SIE6_9BASI|nr:hypothetical protein PCASD_19958 [Puccinia coronata f. sp. avenae]